MIATFSEWYSFYVNMNFIDIFERSSDYFIN